MRELTVASVMNSSVIAVRPETRFKNVVALLAKNRISAVPVIDEHDRPLGVVSEADALAKPEFHGGATNAPSLLGRPGRRTRWRKAAGMTAVELMTSPAVTIGEDESVTAAARRLADKRLRRLFVVDADGALIGVLSRHDILGMFLRSDTDIAADIEEQVLGKGMWLIPGTVTVQVTDGVATLDGKLDHRSSVEALTRLTQAVPGVVGVHTTVGYAFDDTVSAGL